MTYSAAQRWPHIAASGVSCDPRKLVTSLTLQRFYGSKTSIGGVLEPADGEVLNA